MSTDDIDDKDLDAFIAGEDALSRQLKALPQGEPSAELDAAILKRVKFALAQEQRPVAANDPAPSRLGAGWRWTAGIAATVVAGVLAHHALRESREVRPVYEEAPAVQAPAPAAIPAPEPAQESKALALPPPPPPHAVAKKPAPIAVPPPPAPPAPSVEAAPAAPATNQALEAMSRRAALPEASYSRASTPQSPAQTLAAIQADLNAGREKEALQAWRHFRIENPDYPVLPELADKLNALKD
jgi:type IV secretory pathway VirB10-like protein